MARETFGFTISTAYGKELTSPIDATAEYEKFESFGDVTEKQKPDEKDMLNFVNARNKASARASETLKQLEAAGHKKPTLEDSEEMRYNQILKALLAGKVTEDVAKQQATELTGYTPQ